MGKKKVICAESKILCSQVRKFMRRRGITVRSVASKVGKAETSVTRVLSGRQSPTLDTIIPILKAVGLKLQIEHDTSLFLPAPGTIQIDSG